MGEGIRKWIVDMGEGQMDNVHGQPTQGHHTSAEGGIMRDRQVEVASRKKNVRLVSFQGRNVVREFSVACKDGEGNR